MSNLNNYQGNYQEVKYIITALNNNKFLVVVKPPSSVKTSFALPVEKFESIEECNQAVQQYIDYLISNSDSSTDDEFKRLK